MAGRISQRVDQVPTGDITSVVAGDGLSGGGSAGAVSLAVDVNELTVVTAATSDYIAIEDVTDNSTKKALISDVVTAGDITSVVAGTNLSGGATSGAATLNLAIDAAVEFGSDGSGVDVSFHSDTGSDLMFWDSSAESLTITGTNGQDSLVVADGDVSITDALTVTGTTTTYLNVITDSTTTRTPALTDASAYILCTHGTGMTVTLPQDSAVAFPTGSSIVFERNGAGTLTFAAGTGATVNSKGGTLTCADRYTTVAAVKIAADTWTIFGNIG